MIKTCIVCGGPVARRGKTCSSECGHIAKLRYDQKYNRGRPGSEWDRCPRICLHCRSSFEPAHVGQLYCGRQCSSRAGRARERTSGTRYSGDYHRHRAKKFGRRYVPIKPITIFDRDGWVCQICKKQVPRNLTAPHPLYPTLDHIIPMSCEGGDHVPENVRLAHHQCNSERGVGGAVQLALIG